MLFASLLFGISASLDALIVGIGYGIRGIRIRPWQNLAISLITLLGTCLSVGLGHRLVAFLPGLIGQYAGSLVLILLGFYYILKWMRPLLRPGHFRQIPVCESSPEHHVKLRCPANSMGPADLETASADSDSLAYLRLPEVLALSLTLSLNNLSAGLSASLAGLTLVPAAVSTLACSVLFLFAGNRLGRNPVLQFTGRAAEPLSGALLITLGIIQFFL